MPEYNEEFVEGLPKLIKKFIKKNDDEVVCLSEIQEFQEKHNLENDELLKAYYEAYDVPHSGFEDCVW